MANTGDIEWHIGPHAWRKGWCVVRISYNSDDPAHKRILDGTLHAFMDLFCVLPDADSIDNLGMPARVHTVLKREGIQSIAALRAMSDIEIMAIRGVGLRGIAAIRAALNMQEAS